MTELEFEGLKLLLAFLTIPLLLVYLYGVARFISTACSLIKDFLDALEWRTSDWIANFKYNRKQN